LKRPDGIANPAFRHLPLAAMVESRAIVTACVIIWRSLAFMAHVWKVP
jgi:hypothetical protein